MCTACSEESLHARPKRKPAAKAKVAKVMDEFASGDLKSSSGEPVKKKSMARAIALSEARKV
jgi:hypothetical protein